VELDPAHASEILRHGEIEVAGRLAWSSNATLLAGATLDGVEMPLVYKPRRGERPLWDFPDGTLCLREVASYELSDALGWSIVPETVLRDGPFGVGMVQRFVEHDPDEHYFTLLEEHADELRRFAIFDVLVNNADRKGGHCLRELSTSHVWGIDHGLTFHLGPKLRTVIWDFAGDKLPQRAVEDVCRVMALLEGPLADRFDELLSGAELAALLDRASELLHVGVLPAPEEGYHSVPWPLV
jgi:Phosphatidylinositol 3- and 4-kinase